MDEEKVEQTAVDEIGTKGVFSTNLKRNFKQIRDDRAEAITEDVYLIYKRTIEDLRLENRKLQRQRENMLDIAPANTQSITFEKVDALNFVEKDLKLAIEIRENEIKAEEAVKRFKYLFGETI